MRKMITLLWISGCVSSSQQASGNKCLDALAALDEDGDTYLADGYELPASCSDQVEADVLAASGLSEGDCDDSDADIHPEATDDCLGQIDKNCDGEVDALGTWYTDSDDDTYGDLNSPVQDCVQPDGSVENADDCDDGDSSINPDAVETQCGDDVADLNCDGKTDCALTGAISLDGNLGDLGTWVALAAGGGAVLAGEDDLAVAGGDEAAWTITSEDRDAAAALLDLGFEAGEEAGADVAVVDGVVAVGGPLADPSCLVGTTTTTCVDGGAVEVVRKTGADALVTGDSLLTYLGRRLGGGGGMLSVGRYGGSTWDVYLLPVASLPAGGSSTQLSDFDVTVLPGLSGGASTPPALALAKNSGTLSVAVGQPESGEYQVKVWTDADFETPVARIAASTSDTLGTSVALVDLNDSGTLDLVVGDPGAKTVYVFVDPSGDLTAADADYTFSGDTATGQSLANAGDINGDGVDDLLIGARNTAYLILGGNLGRGHDLSAYAAFSTSTDTDLGASLASADLDGDHFSDLLLGAPGAGGVYVLWGGP